MARLPEEHISTIEEIVLAWLRKRLSPVSICKPDLKSSL
jgi:hypothetical protein